MLYEVITIMCAAFVTMEAVNLQGAPDWLAGGVGALAFAGAIAINFAPDIADSGGQRSYFHKQFHGNRRRQKRRQARQHA